MTTTLRRTLLAILPTLAAPALASAPRPIRLVVPFPAGGGVDVFARSLGPALSAALGQPAVIENIGGASSRLGTQAVARAAPDGGVLLVTNDTLAAIEALPPPGAAPLLPALQPVTLAIAAPNLVVTHSRRGIADIGAYARRLGALNVGVPGLGTAHHLTSEMLAAAVGARPQHVPYRGGGPLLADLLAGTVDAAVVTLGAAIEHIRDGRLIGLAVTGPRRSAAAPDVPTLAETVAPGFELLSWQGVLAPAGLPPETAARIHAAVLAALADPTVASRLVGLGFDIAPEGEAAFGALLRGTVARFAEVIAAAGIRPGEA